MNGWRLIDHEEWMLLMKSTQKVLIFWFFLIISACVFEAEAVEHTFKIVILSVTTKTMLNVSDHCKTIGAV